MVRGATTPQRGSGAGGHCARLPRRHRAGCCARRHCAARGAGLDCARRRRPRRPLRCCCADCGWSHAAQARECGWQPGCPCHLRGCRALATGRGMAAGAAAARSPRPEPLIAAAWPPHAPPPKRWDPHGQRRPQRPQRPAETPAGRRSPTYWKWAAGKRSPTARRPPRRPPCRCCCERGWGRACRCCCGEPPRHATRAALRVGRSAHARRRQAMAATRAPTSAAGVWAVAGEAALTAGSMRRPRHQRASQAVVREGGATPARQPAAPRPRCARRARRATRPARSSAR